MFKEAIKELALELRVVTKDLEKSFVLMCRCRNHEELKHEFSNSLRYKYLSLLRIYEEWIGIQLKELELYSMGMSIDSGIVKLYDEGDLNLEELEFLKMAKQIKYEMQDKSNEVSDEVIIGFLSKNWSVMMGLEKLMNSYIE